MATPATFASPSLLGWAWMAQRPSRLRSRTLTAFGIEPNDKSGPLNSTSEPLTRGEPSLRRVARMCVSAASNRDRIPAARSLASFSNCPHVVMLSSLPAGSAGDGAAEEGLDEGGGRGEFGGGAFHADLAAGQDVGVVGDGQHRPGALLDH